MNSAWEVQYINIMRYMLYAEADMNALPGKI